jgi:hypothetical protein
MLAGLQASCRIKEDAKVFTPEGIFEKWARGEDVQLGDFESEQLRGWVYRKLSDIAVAAERGAVEETHRALAEALSLR